MAVSCRRGLEDLKINIQQGSKSTDIEIYQPPSELKIRYTYLSLKFSD